MNKPIKNQTVPKLDAPGAGLPLPQMLIIRYLIGPFISKRTPRDKSRQDYEKLTARLITLIEQVPTDQRKTKILVPPQRGLEDSSRYWSLDELVEHLLIVSRSIESVILALASGQIPSGKADTAKVKPIGSGQSFWSEFTTYAPNLMESLDQRLAQPSLNFNSPLKFQHPWFGPMTAKQWYWLLAQHQGIHYQQAKNIVKQLPASS